MYSLLALLLLSTVSLAFDPYDFMPCAFQVTTYTHIYSGGAEIATSEDALYRDHDNLWRWESEFSGLSGLFDSHVWVVIWRPDYGASYHHHLLSGQCLKNNGAKQMYPYPYEWIASKMSSIEWSEDYVTFDDKPSVKYTVKGKSTQYKFTLEANIFTYKTGEFVFANGTVQSNMIDVEFKVDVNQFVTNTPVAPKLFQTVKPCEEVTLPADPSKDFSKLCYRHPTSSSSTGAGFAVIPSIFTLFVILLVCIAL